MPHGKAAAHVSRGNVPQSSDPCTDQASQARSAGQEQEHIPFSLRDLSSGHAAHSGRRRQPAADRDQRAPKHSSQPDSPQRPPGSGRYGYERDAQHAQQSAER
eukprot:2077674-Prymnesium_polylepis.3